MDMNFILFGTVVGSMWPMIFFFIFFFCIWNNAMAAMTLKAVKSLYKNGCSEDAMILICPHWLVGIIVPFIIGGIVLESIVCCIPYAYWGRQMSKSDDADGADQQVPVRVMTGQTNDEDAPLSKGTGNCSHKYYCGRFFGKAQLPNSNGHCGPNNGPQCQSCQRFQFGNQNANNNANPGYNNYANNNNNNIPGFDNNNTNGYMPPSAPAYNPSAPAIDNPNLLTYNDLNNANSFNNAPPPSYTAAPPSYNDATSAPSYGEGSPGY